MLGLCVNRRDACRELLDYVTRNHFYDRQSDLAEIDD